MNCMIYPYLRHGAKRSLLILSVVALVVLIGSCSDVSSSGGTDSGTNNGADGGTDTTTTLPSNPYTRAQSIVIVNRLMAELPAVEQLYTLNRAVGSDTTVVLAWEGGPKASINCVSYNDYIPTDQYATAVVHEGQQQDVTRVKLRNAGTSSSIISLVENGSVEVTAEEAATVNLLSYAILEKVRQHFVDDGKRVVFVGHSFGAVLLPGYLTIVGNNFDKIMLLAGRTEMPLDIINGFHSGNTGGFSLTPDPADAAHCTRMGTQFTTRQALLDSITNSGMSFMTEEACGGLSYQTAFTAAYALSTFRLQANAASNYRSADLYKLDLSNLLVVTGRNDAAVGVMNSSEIQGLRGANATVCVTNDGHGLNTLGTAGTMWLPQFIGGTTTGICPTVANTVSCS